ncbi:MAG: phosphodiesterase [Pseudomonadota bacterium]
MILAQITDLHIVDKGELLWNEWDSATGLERAVVRLNALEPKPDFLIVTGDMVDLGSTSNYAHLAEHLGSLTMPFGLIPGNHDGRENLTAANLGHLPDSDAAPFYQYAIDLPPIRLIALDTLDEGKSSGALCEMRLTWLERRLAENRAVPTVVAMHHPPVASGAGFMDGIGLTRGGDEFAKIIAAAPNVVRIVCGHQHRSTVATLEDAVVQICPSTTVQIPFDLGPDLPLPLTPEPPAFLLHLWHHGQLVSHSLYVDSY